MRRVVVVMVVVVLVVVVAAPRQKFGTISGQINCSLLLLSCMALVYPSVLTASDAETSISELAFSRITRFWDELV